MRPQQWISKQRISRHWIVLGLVLLLLGGGVVSACGSKEVNRGVSLTLADSVTMPVEVQNSPLSVAEAYRFAAANPDILRNIPCYCGCGPMGHESNYSCFWQEGGALETHAMDCGLCVDIAQDTMRGLRQGHSLANIRDQIDADYNRFGPSTDTPPVSFQPQG